MALGIEFGDSGLNPNMPYDPSPGVLGGGVIGEYSKAALAGMSLGEGNFSDVSDAALRAVNDSSAGTLGAKAQIDAIVDKMKATKMRMDSVGSDVARDAARRTLDSLTDMLEKSLANFAVQRVRFERAKHAYAVAKLAESFDDRGLHGEAGALKNEALNALGTAIPINEKEIAAEAIVKLRGSGDLGEYVDRTLNPDDPLNAGPHSGFMAKQMELVPSFGMPFSTERRPYPFPTDFSDRLIDVSQQAGTASRADAIAAMGSSAVPNSALESMKRIRSLTRGAISIGQGGPMGEVSVEDQTVELGDLAFLDFLGDAVSAIGDFASKAVQAAVPAAVGIGAGILTGNFTGAGSAALGFVNKLFGGGGPSPAQQQAAQQAAADAAARVRGNVPGTGGIPGWVLIGGGLAVGGLIIYLISRKR